MDNKSKKVTETVPERKDSLENNIKRINSDYENNNLNSIKKQLQSYSLSTTTTGLVGEERYEELKLIKDAYKKKYKKDLDKEFKSRLIFLLIYKD